MEEKTQETELKLSKSQLQTVINTHLSKEEGLNDLFSMLVNGLMLSERSAFLRESDFSFLLSWAFTIALTSNSIEIAVLKMVFCFIINLVMVKG